MGCAPGSRDRNRVAPNKKTGPVALDLMLRVMPQSSNAWAENRALVRRRREPTANWGWCGALGWGGNIGTLRIPARAAELHGSDMLHMKKDPIILYFLLSRSLSKMKESSSLSLDFNGVNFFYMNYLWKRSERICHRYVASLVIVFLFLLIVLGRVS